MYRSRTGHRASLPSQPRAQHRHTADNQPPKNAVVSDKPTDDEILKTMVQNLDRMLRDLAEMRQMMREQTECMRRINSQLEDSLDRLTDMLNEIRQEPQR